MNPKFKVCYLKLENYREALSKTSGEISTSLNQSLNYLVRESKVVLNFGKFI